MANARPLQLLERDSFLSTLRADLAAAAAGDGRTVVVSGEAGIGKTSLVEAFAASGDIARVLWGACEALSTPHPLGPLHDLARTAAGPLKSRLAAGGARAALFTAVIDELAASPSPAVLVLEDIHWADCATLDLVKFLSRRIHRVPALMVVTCRDDVAACQDLTAVLGELPARHVTRIALPRLSPQGVATLAARAMRHIAELHDITGGNPFFVSELLGHAGDSLPSTVRDAVLGKAVGLDDAARDVLDLTAIVPRAIELALVDAVLAPASAAVERCIACGLLQVDGEALRFRHELARVAVEQSLSPLRARTLHARLLAALVARGAGLARIVHHAHKAADTAAVLDYAPRAAAEAAARGALREAAAHCRTAFTCADGLTPQRYAELLDDFASYAFEVNDLAAAIPAREAAIELYERTGDLRRQCAALAAHAMPLVRALRNADADAASDRAIALAQALPAGPELAKAHAIAAYLRMLDRDYENAVTHGEKAIALADALGDRAILASAHSSMGAALMFVDHARGCAHLAEALAIADAVEDGGAAKANAYSMLGAASGELYALDAAERHLADGIAFARSRDLDRLAGYMEAWKSLCDVLRGRYDAAAAGAHAVLAREPTGSTNRVVALVALGRLRTRRGEPGLWDILDEALALATRSGTLQRIAPVRGARAEAAWLAGDDECTAHQARAAFALACEKGHPWFIGEGAYWLWKAGELRTPPAPCAEPFALQIAGRWQEAADAWERLGCPYEQARALAEGDEGAQRAALTILDALAAKPLAERLRRQMREAGVKAVPRGPRPSTRQNAAGLTTREIEVLELIAEGRQNAQIAARLSRSPRTVDHHLASILAKLDTANRGEAVAAARKLGILPQVGQAVSPK
jgi:DNA-binding CsgD family transcriptional regulator